MDYRAPTRDMRFVLTELLDYQAVTDLPAFSEVSDDLVAAVLEEAARFTGNVLAPLNKTGDQEGCRWKDGEVTTPKGFVDAYAQYVENGWNSLPCPPEYDGQGLPASLATAVQEMLNAANMSFALGPLLTAGAIEAINNHGSDAQKTTYLPKLVSGEWTGTMNLTEPQAGSDLAQVRSRAQREGDHYLVQGQKIFITWGEHDCTENIIHLVLARTPDAPPGVKGISLFIVPKFLVNRDGSLGKRNDVRCVSIEHKLGIHGSPTCTMAYGDEGGAVGYLVGEEGKGLAYMFTMMNEARHKVGLQGLAIADRAYQQALWYASDRIQGKPLVRKDEEKSIIGHPDVRRLLMTMKSGAEAMRALAYYAAYHMDLAHHHGDDAERRRSQARVDLLIPIVKGWSTELGVELASLGVQVHGGMGFVEETGAAQHYRDARITTIYEGTTAIQANDLIGRKTHRDQGAAMKALVAEFRDDQRSLEQAGGDLGGMAEPPGRARDALEQAAAYVANTHGEEPADTAAASVPYLMLAGFAAGGALMARSAVKAAEAMKAGDSDAAFYEAKIISARFYADHLLPRAVASLPAVQGGGRWTNALTVEQFRHQ
ncbi:MAG: acyl-CoA dehydrogenase C-terminal domain-containing protein [Ectothiorhodospiraceae bacterium]|nr:acyl-CoA dehydrogenase C-terminal domain-containing protein [Ectothiorhodospiraceae bacterium]